MNQNKNFVPKLSKGQEKLLVRYMDGECSFVEDLLVKMILRLSINAREFVADLHNVDKATKAWAESNVSSAVVGSATAESLNMWQRIERRILQEEHSAIFHGERTPVKEELGLAGSIFEKVFNKSLFGGMAVGVATAALAFVVLDQGGDIVGPVGSEGNKIAILTPADPHNVASGVEFVSYPESSNRANSPRRNPSEEAYRVQRDIRSMRKMEIPFQVDWMRSDGHVRFIQDARKGSTVIWVDRETSKSDRPVVLEVEPKLFTPYSIPINR